MAQLPDDPAHPDVFQLNNPDKGGQQVGAAHPTSAKSACVHTCVRGLQPAPPTECGNTAGGVWWHPLSSGGAQGCDHPFSDLPCGSQSYSLRVIVNNMRLHRARPRGCWDFSTYTPLRPCTLQQARARDQQVSSQPRGGPLGPSPAASQCLWKGASSTDNRPWLRRARHEAVHLSCPGLGF